MAAVAVELLAQIEVERFFFRLRRQSQTLLQRRQILRERRRRKFLGDLAEPLAEVPAPLDDAQVEGIAIAQHRDRGVVVFGKRGYSTSAHRGERIGEAASLDNVRRRDWDVLF